MSRVEKFSNRSELTCVLENRCTQIITNQNKSESDEPTGFSHRCSGSVDQVGALFQVIPTALALLGETKAQTCVNASFANCGRTGCQSWQLPE